MSSPETENQSSVPKVLARNSACHQCRKRKLKCDAFRPICTNCSKPRPRADPNGETGCTWDESGGKAEKAGNSRARKRQDTDEIKQKKARLQELEERVSAFEKTLREQNDGPSVTGLSEPISGVSQVFGGASIGEVSSAPLQNLSHWENGVLSAGTSSGPSPASWRFNAQEPITNPLPAPTAAHTMGTLPDGGMTDFNNMFGLVWPDWPVDLPPLEVVEHIVGVFFEKVPTVPKMLHKASLLSSLLLPPSNYSFPSPALLHAILGLTAPYISPTLLASRHYFPVGTPLHHTTHPVHDFEATSATQPALPGHIQSNRRGNDRPVTPSTLFQSWHQRKSFQMMGADFDSGARLAQLVQAQICATQIDAYNARWTDLWMEAGSCLRMCVPLRLNETVNVPLDALHRGRQHMMPPATSAMDQASRERTWWMAYLTERSVIMSTCWAESLADTEITVELPVTQAIFDSGVGDMVGLQTISSPDFFSHHPDRHADGFLFFIKALKLFTDVSRFFRQYGRGSHSVAAFLAHPQLRMFFSQINAFRLSFPAHLRRPTAVSQPGEGAQAVDVDLIAAICITHGATLAVGEPVINKEMYHTDVARMCLSAIRAVLSLLYDITSTSFEFSLFPYVCSYMWFVCAKGLVRFVDAAVHNGDFVSASVYRSELEVFRMALQRYSERHPIGERHLQMLDDLIQLQAESSTEFETRAMFDMLGNANVWVSADFSCRKEQVFRGSGQIYQLPSPATQSTPTGAHFFTPPTGSANTPASSKGVSGFSPRFASTPNTANSGGAPAASPGYMMMGQGETWEGMAGLDMSKWFDIPNLSYDESSMEYMVELAKQSGLTFTSDTGVAF